MPVWTGRSRRRAHRGEVHPAINGVGDQLQDRAVLGRPDQASTSPIRHSKQLGVQLTQQMASIRRVPHAVNRTASDHDSSASACRQGTPRSGPWGRVGGGTGSTTGGAIVSLCEHAPCAVMVSTRSQFGWLSGAPRASPSLVVVASARACSVRGVVSLGGCASR